MHQAFRRHAALIIVCFAYLAMSFLCVQQARTIASQRKLIQSLFQDSLELNSIKVQHIQELLKH